jgi:murein endopeptidase
MRQRAELTQPGRDDTTEHPGAGDRRRRPAILAALATLAAIGAAGTAALIAEHGPDRRPAPRATVPTPPRGPSASRRAPPPIAWRHSRAAGLPDAGRLVRGVKLPAEGPDWFTWDAVRKRSPNRASRRWGTDRLVRTLLHVLHAYRAAHPGAPRVGIADLSRPHGGTFGARFGGLGHASHQNGLDADVLYPRTDHRELRAYAPRLVDRALAQDLVDRFVRAGAQYVFVGPRVRLHGRRAVVQHLVHHDDHLHVRIGIPHRPADG